MKGQEPEPIVEDHIGVLPDRSSYSLQELEQKLKALKQENLRCAFNTYLRIVFILFGVYALTFVALGTEILPREFRLYFLAPLTVATILSLDSWIRDFIRFLVAQRVEMRARHLYSYFTDETSRIVRDKYGSS